MTTNALARTKMYVEISRIHRRNDLIKNSLQQEGIQGEEKEEAPETMESNNNPLINLTPTVNWLDFWKRAKVYPEQLVAYPDASQHVSSRRRRSPGFQKERARANAYVSDTDDSDSEEDVVIQ
jgi:hypothetical protein